MANTTLNRSDAQGGLLKSWAPIIATDAAKAKERGNLDAARIFRTWVNHSLESRLAISVRDIVSGVHSGMAGEELPAEHLQALSRLYAGVIECGRQGELLPNAHTNALLTECENVIGADSLTLDHCGRLVTRLENMAGLWPGIVFDSALHVLTVAAEWTERTETKKDTHRTGAENMVNYPFDADNPQASAGAVTPSQYLNPTGAVRKPPGHLRTVYDHAMTRAVKPRREFALATALAVGSVICGRRWRTAANNYSALSLLVIAETASGKDKIGEVAEELLLAAELPHKIGRTSYTSGSAVFSALVAQPCHMAVQDEVGQFLAGVRARSQSMERTAFEELMKISASPHRPYKGRQYSEAHMTDSQREFTRQTVARPCLTWIGLTTPLVWENVVRETDIEGGFLNRMLTLYVSGDNRTPRIPDYSRPIDKALLQWMRDTAGDDTDTPEDAPDAQRLKFTASALYVLRQFTAECEQLAERYRKKESPLYAMTKRLHETAMRISLICALARGNTRRIKRADMDYACHVVGRFAAAQLDRMERHFGADAEERLNADIVDAIPRGTIGSSFRTIYRKFSRHFPDAGELRDTLDVLTAQGRINAIEVPAIRDGMARLRYVRP